MSKRVLLIKLTSMGDLMHALPALTDAARAIPGIQFDWVVDESFAEVPGWHPAVNQVIRSAHRRWSLHSSISYTLVTEGAQNTDLGDRLHYDLAAVYRVLGASHDDGRDGHDDHGGHRDSPALDFVLELNGIWEGKHDVDGHTDQDSGGNLYMVSPGVRLTLANRWSLFLSGSVPISQELNGDNHELDYRITSGVNVAL